MKNIFKSTIVFLLTLEARLLLARHHPTIIAVTGSVGKTSTKDAIYAVVKDKAHARKSEKSFNSELGVPLSILGLQNAWNNPIGWLKNLFDGALAALFTRSYPEVLVLEMGVDRPGDMRRLTKWIKPDILVLTSLPDVPVHVEYFDSPEAVIAEKLVLLENLKPKGKLIFNQDDERVAIAAAPYDERAISYGRAAADFSFSGGKLAKNETGQPSGYAVSVAASGQVENLVLRGTLGEHRVYSALAALAVGSLFRVSFKRAVEILSDLEPTPGRMRLLKGVKNSLIIDDTYNASPTATLAALKTLGDLNGLGRRRVAVLGDMLELGKYSAGEHERIGQVVPGSADLLITIGMRARKIVAAALAGGLPTEAALAFDDVAEAVKSVPELIQDGDVTLIKGSQSIRAEKLVKALMAEPDQADRLLVRQDPMWEKR